MAHQLFKITQSAVIKNSSGQVLILKHPTGKYLLPGGKINEGESWMDGLRREVFEETAITNFTVAKILDVDTWIDENKQAFCAITYLVELQSEPTIKLSKEHNEFVWAELSNLDNYDFWTPKIKERIQKAFV